MPSSSGGGLPNRYGSNYVNNDDAGSWDALAVALMEAKISILKTLKFCIQEESLVLK